MHNNDSNAAPNRRASSCRRICLITLLVGIATGSVATIFIQYTLSQPKYTVAECLVGMRMRFPENTDPDQRGNVIREFLDHARRYQLKHDTPMFSGAFDPNDRTLWYLLYHKDCENKRKITQTYIDAYRSAYPSTIAEFEVLKQDVKPTRYNAAYGDAWIDGREERPIE